MFYSISDVFRIHASPDKNAFGRLVDRSIVAEWASDEIGGLTRFVEKQNSPLRYKA